MRWLLDSNVLIDPFDHWEQGSRTPSGAAQVLLRIAARHREAVLDAAA